MRNSAGCRCSARICTDRRYGETTARCALLFLWATKYESYRVFCPGQGEPEGRQGLYGVGLVVGEMIYRKSVYTHQLIDERVTSMRYELTGKSVAMNLAVAYPPAKASPTTQLEKEYRKRLGHMVEQIPT